jgi:hypothetical protein
VKLDDDAALTKQKRIRKLYREYIEGDYTNSELAARHGVSDNTIAYDLSVVRAMIAMDFDEEELKEDLHKRLLQMESTIRESFEGFKRSRRDQTEISTRYDKKTCRTCKGEGEKDGIRCERCEGRGYKIEEVVTRKVSGQAGDPRFLALIQKGVSEICRIKGHYPKKERAEKKVEVNVQTWFDGADPELINRHRELVVQQRRLLIQMAEGKNGSPDKKEGEVLDVESEETEEKE